MNKLLLSMMLSCAAISYADPGITIDIDIIIDPPRPQPEFPDTFVDPIPR